MQGTGRHEEGGGGEGGLMHEDEPSCSYVSGLHDVRCLGLHGVHGLGLHGVHVLGLHGVQGLGLHGVQGLGQGVGFRV